LAEASANTKFNLWRNNMEQHDWDNYSRQLNDENDAYWQSRGEDECPDD